MPIFRFNRAVGIGRGVKAFLSLEGGVTRGAVPRNNRRRKQASKLKAATKQIEKQRRMLEKKERKISQLKMLLSATDNSARSSPERRTSSRTAGESEAGALPDFIIIGAQKCGTSYLYRLLGQHTYVEPANIKEVHYFDLFFEEGVDWYRSNFPPPAWKNGQRIITGEASPYYLYHPHAARRAAAVVPWTRLIVLLRNPVDRAYSHYNHQVRAENETLSFDEAVEAEQDRLRGERDKMLVDERYVSLNDRRFSYLSRGVYVDQVQEWHKFFTKDQVLVLKSEDLFDYTQDTLSSVLDFLHLPDWHPEPSKLSKPPRKKGRYAPMNSATRQRLKDYFEPHNRRLYEYLGMDFGW